MPWGGPEQEQGPTALILTRQDLPPIDRKECAQAKGLERGGYILWQSAKAQPDIILIANRLRGSHHTQAARELAEEGMVVRVVSLPCWEIFDAQCLNTGPPYYPRGEGPCGSGSGTEARLGTLRGARGKSSWEWTGSGPAPLQASSTRNSVSRQPPYAIRSNVGKEEEK